MRIGHLTDCYKPVINGVTRYVSLLKRVLESWGHEVYVFTLGNEDYPDDEPNVVRSPAIPLSDTGYHLSFWYSREARDLAERMDILHAHHPFLAGRQAVRIVEDTGAPLVFTNHSRYHLQARYYLPPFIPEELSDGFVKAYLSWFTSHCDLVVAPSKGVAAWLRELGVEGPIEVIPNGIDVERVANPTAPVRKSDVGLEPDDVVAIYVGRVAPEKNLEFLLRAFSRAAARVRHLHLLVVGDGPAREHLEEFARWAGIGDRVHLVGAVAYEDVPNWLAVADFFVITSTVETHPLAVLEALAAGLPVLGVAATGVEDSVVDGVSGLLVPEDVRLFAERMVELASDGDLRRRLAAGAVRARDRFDIRATASQLVRHYQRLVEERLGWRESG